MDFFRANITPISRTQLAQTSVIYRECPCEDLPNNHKASRVVLKLPFSLPHKPPSTPFLLRTQLRKPVKISEPRMTIAEIDNHGLYKVPIFVNSSSKTQSLDILPHRFGVECNYFKNVRNKLKTRPKLRKLVLKIE